MTDETPDRTPWWRDAVIYQVYIRSFADADGDGIGDIAGIRGKLPYLADLGVDALWINPWYVSPQADAGYDVADYRTIEPAYGTVADAEKLIADAHEHGMRLVPDIVPNHTSDQHAWFRAALESRPGSAERARYVFRPGRGLYGEEPPNNWRSHFGGPAWTRTTDPDGEPGEWYLHLFDPGQPDLEWTNPEVRAEFEAILRFWFDRGVDGFRIDVAHGLVKDPDLPDIADTSDFGGLTYPPGAHPFADREPVLEIYESWRRIADAYPGQRMFVAEAWTPGPERLARYVAEGRLHTAFNFEYLMAPWDATALRAAIDASTGRLWEVGAPATWVLSNHDVVRHPSRYGRPAQERVGNVTFSLDDPPDLELGTRRARAALLLEAALPGGMYVYQGEELGLPEVEDIPDDARQDPTWARSGNTERGRDGARVPMPWSGDAPPYGFSPPSQNPDDRAPTWLPQPDGWGPWTAAAQADVAGSMLELYRDVLRRRRAHPALGEGDMTWVSAPDDAVLHLRREPGFAALVNLSPGPVALPDHAGILVASGPLDDGLLPPDTAVWLAVDP